MCRVGIALILSEGCFDCHHLCGDLWSVTFGGFLCWKAMM